MNADYKFGIAEPQHEEWTYGNIWADEETTVREHRLVIAPTRAQTSLIASLLKDLPEPFWVLYVLVVPRGHGKAGRYQSPEPQTGLEVTRFLHEFSTFFEKDGRHNVWIASASNAGMLVYDRHNVVYGYGPLNAWRLALAAEGFSEAPEVRFPSPHSHHYHERLDPEEDRLLKYWCWQHTP